MAVNKNFKKCIEKVKYEFSITQKEIAFKLKVHNTYLSDMINGRVPLTDQIASKIYELFHIEVESESEENIQQKEEKPNEVSEPIILYTCPECINKQRDIDSLKRENLDLRANIEDLRNHIRLLEFNLGKYRKNGSE